MAPPPRFACAAALVFTLLGSTAPHTRAQTSGLPEGLYAEWTTPRGSFTAELFYELAPLTVANFVGLAEGTIPFEHRPAGQPFYDGLVFHRVVPGFVAQGGDPFGTGQGTPGHVIADEFSPRLKHDTAGTLSMANAGPNDNGCQFFLTLAPVNRLNYKHSVFGRVIRGLDVLPRIQPGDAMQRVAIIRVGPRARSFRADARSFQALQHSTPVIPPRDPALPPLFANEAGLPLVEGFDGWVNQKLHQYASVTGITIHVRLLPRFTASSATGTSAGAGINPPRDLHQQLAGDDPLAVTILFTAEDKRWRLWLGDGLLPRFGLSADTVGREPDARKLHQLKQALLAEAKQLGGSNEPPHRAIDAAVTNVIEALDRPPP